MSPKDSGSYTRNMPHKHPSRAPSQTPAQDIAHAPGSGHEGVHVHAYQLLSRENSRKIDQFAVEQYGMPSIILMENAGRSITEICAPLILDSEDRPSILVLAGAGNNGGDGLVAARHLMNLGARVGIILASSEDHFTGDALTNLTIAKRMGIPIKTFSPEKPRSALSSLPAPLSKPTIIIDAVLGTGFEGTLRPGTAAFLRFCNELGDAGAAIVSVDLPSGLHADAGEPAEDCVEADLTIALAAFKVGMLTESGRALCGEIVCGDIGVPADLLERFAEVVEFECDHEHDHDEDAGELFEEPEDGSESDRERKGAGA